MRELKEKQEERKVYIDTLVADNYYIIYSIFSLKKLKRGSWKFKGKRNKNCKLK